MVLGVCIHILEVKNYRLEQKKKSKNNFFVLTNFHDYFFILFLQCVATFCVWKDKVIWLKKVANKIKE